MLVELDDEILAEAKRERNDRVEQYTKKREKAYRLDHPNNMRHWSNDDIDHLIALIRKGHKICEIAGKLGRSYKTICHQKYKYNKLLEAGLIVSRDHMRLPASKIRALVPGEVRKHKKRWSIQDIQVLELMIDAAEPYRDIAIKLDRPITALKAAANKIRMIRRCGYGLTVKTFSAPKEFYRELLRQQ